CHNYNDTTGALPVAVQKASSLGGPFNGSMTNINTNFGPNWVVLVMPFIEQDNLYKQYATSIQNYMINQDATWRGMTATKIKTMLCPSDGAGAGLMFNFGGRSWAAGNYACNAGGIHQDAGGPNTSSLVGWESTEGGASPSSGGSSTTSWVPYGTHGGGVMCINFALTVATIPDGSSNTVMLSEVRNGPTLGASDPRGILAVSMPG